MNHTVLIAVAALAVLGLFALVANGRRKARKARQAAREVVHTASVTGRVLVAAAAITGIQFAVIRYAHNPMVLLAALAAPALLAAVPLVRAMTVTSVAATRKGARR